MIDEPQIFQIEFSEIDDVLLIQSMNYEEVLNMPFDSTVPAIDVSSAQERVIWALNTCVRNLPEIKESLNKKITDKPTQAGLILFIYQSCVAINPAIDMAVWNYMVRQPNIYHEMFNAAIFDLEDPSNIIRTAFESMLLGDGMTLEDAMFLPDISPPPWANQLTPKRQSAEKGQEVKKDKSKLNVKNIMGLQNHLESNLIGQSEAIDTVVKTLKRAVVGMKDENRPLGVFLFAGASGVGKSFTSKLIQEHLFGKDSRLVRIDCGEFQQKHDSMKLTGAPASYTGYEEGGLLTNAIKNSQNTVLLLDEAEKAHRDFWDVFLKVFDEGFLTDNHGEEISFENTIVIITSNLGNEKIATSSFSKGTGFNVAIEDNYGSKSIPKREFVEKETKSAINKFFKPELVNRLDDIVIFNYLSDEDLLKVAKIELKGVLKKVRNIDYEFRWTSTAEKALAFKSQKAIAGAREMSRIRRNLIEDEIAKTILNNDIEKKSTFVLTAKKNNEINDYDFIIRNETSAKMAGPKKAFKKNERD